MYQKNIRFSSVNLNSQVKDGLLVNQTSKNSEITGQCLIQAIIINDNDIKSVIPFPNTIGNVLSPDDESPTISGKVVSKETDEKQNPYGSNKVSIEISNGIIAELDWFCITSPQPIENRIIPTIELANHPKMGFPFQLYGF